MRQLQRISSQHNMTYIKLQESLLKYLNYRLQALSDGYETWFNANANNLEIKQGRSVFKILFSGYGLKQIMILENLK